MTYCASGPSCTNIELTACSKAAKYRPRVSPGFGEARCGSHPRCAFMFSKASSHYESQVNSSSRHRAQKKGRHLSPERDMNRLSAARVLVSYCISLTDHGGYISVMVQIFSKLVSIPLRWMMNPRNLLELTPKVHFEGLKHMLNRLRVRKVSARSVRCMLADLLFTIMSSM